MGQFISFCFASSYASLLPSTVPPIYRKPVEDGLTSDERAEKSISLAIFNSQIWGEKIWKVRREKTEVREARFGSAAGLEQSLEKVVGERRKESKS